MLSIPILQPFLLPRLTTKRSSPWERPFGFCNCPHAHARGVTGKHSVANGDTVSSNPCTRARCNPGKKIIRTSDEVPTHAHARDVTSMMAHLHHHDDTFQLVRTREMRRNSFVAIGYRAIFSFSKIFPRIPLPLPCPPDPATRLEKTIGYCFSC